MSHHHNHNHAPHDRKTPWIIGGIVVFLLLIAIGLAVSSGVSQENKIQAQPSTLQALEERYDFGTVSMANGVVTKAFEIENQGDAPLVIRKVYTSCMCTSASLQIGSRKLGPFGMPGHGVIPTINQNLAQGDTATVEVTFDPAAHGPAGVGTIVRNIFVETADGNKLTLEIRAQVTP